MEEIDTGVFAGTHCSSLGLPVIAPDLVAIDQLAQLGFECGVHFLLPFIDSVEA